MADEPKVISIRLTNGSLHLRARLYAMTHGLTFGKLVSIALREYLVRNESTTHASHTAKATKAPKAGLGRSPRPRTPRRR